VITWLATFPDRVEMQVSPETIYQALCVQGRGHLRADLHQHLHTGRAVRSRRRATAQGPSGKIPDMIMISERPAEVVDRAVPGHWESNLVELPLGDRHTGRAPDPVHDVGPPTRRPRCHRGPRRPGGDHRHAARAPGHVTHLGQGTDLSVHSAQRLADVATELNERPQKPWAASPPPTRCNAYC